MNLSYNFRISLLLGIIIVGIFLSFPLIENIYTKDESNKTLSISDSSFNNQNLIEKNSKKDQIIPNQFIIYLEGANKEETNSLDPREFYNSELKDTGAELLHVYDNVMKGFAIKVTDEKVLDDLKTNPFVKYIGQDKKISAFANTLPENNTTSIEDK